MLPKLLLTALALLSPALADSGFLSRRDDNDGTDYRNTICEALSGAQCRNITTLTSIQAISQRDVQLNVSTADLMYLAFDLNAALLDVRGYTPTVLADVPQVLFVGFTSLELDLYWNEHEMYWQLCPFDTSDSDVIRNSDDTVSLPHAPNIRCSVDPIFLEDLTVKFKRFLHVTNNDLTTSYLQLRLRLHSIDNARATGSLHKSPPKNQRLSHIVTSSFSKMELYTPLNLEADRRNDLTFGLYGIQQNPLGFLKVFRFLFVGEHRITIASSNRTLLTDTSYDAKTRALDAAVVFNTRYVESRNSEYQGTIPYTMYTSNYTTVISLTTDTFAPPDCLSALTWSQFHHDVVYRADDLSQIVDDGIALQSSSFTVEVTDSEDTPFNDTSIAQYITCGFVPKLSSPVTNLTTLVPLANAAIWSWKPDQPSVPSNIPVENDYGLGSFGSFRELLPQVEAQREKHLGPGSPGYINVNRTNAWRCAVMDKTGWRVANCFDHYPVLCAPRVAQPLTSAAHSSFGERVAAMNTTEVLSSVFSWSVGTNTSYFAASGACPDSDYVFSLPRTSLQDTSARLALEDADAPYPVWIDFNSLSARDCWVTGGPYALCPYTPNTWTRSKIVLISIVFMVIVLIVIAIILLSKDKTPIRHSEGRFRKIIARFNQSQYHGVPS